MRERLCEFQDANAGVDINSRIDLVPECLQENGTKDLVCAETCFCLLFIPEGTFFKKKKSYHTEVLKP